MPSRRIFISYNLSKTPSHRKNTFSLLLAWIEYVKTPSRRKLLIGFPIKSFINKCNCQLLCVSILREPTSTKMSWNWPKIAFYVMKQKPLLKPPSHCFWLDYNLSKHLPVEFATFLQWEGSFDELKMQVMLQKGLWKHLLIAKNSQKCPKIV